VADIEYGSPVYNPEPKKAVEDDGSKKARHISAVSWSRKMEIYPPFLLLLIFPSIINGSYMVILK